MGVFLKRGWFVALLVLMLSGCGLMDEKRTEGEPIEVETFSGDWQFEGQDWGGWVPRSGKWSLTSGTLQYGDHTFQSGSVGLPGKIWKSLTMEVEGRITEQFYMVDTHWMGLIFGARDALGLDGVAQGGLFYLRANGNADLIFRGQMLASASTNARPMEEAARLKVEVDKEAMRFYVNDQFLFAVDGNLYLPGEVGLANYGNTVAFDRVVVEGVLGNQSAFAPASLTRPVEYPPVKPLPRITVVEGEFREKERGKVFHPVGFNHTRLSASPGWHNVFNVGAYDRMEMEKTLQEMAELGANAIRVWAWGEQFDPSGFTGDLQAGKGLNALYMENFIDFLRRANRHGIYVIAVLDEYPKSHYYQSIMEKIGMGDPAITGNNRQFLSPGPLAGKGAAVRDFVKAVKAADPNLLSTVLGWSFSNEACLRISEGPFNRMEGWVQTATGKSYNMAVPEDRQRCYDEGIRHYVDTLSKSVKEVDPEAMTTIGFWISSAHNRKPKNFLLPDKYDARVPPRPSAFALPEPVLDFLDYHVYPWSEDKIPRDVLEWEALEKTGVAAVVGEIGVYTNQGKTREELRTLFAALCEEARDVGFQGGLYWVWDLTQVEHHCPSAIEDEWGAYAMEHLRRIE